MAIDPAKYVDGFHPVNVGKMVVGKADFLPCTPAGIQQILIRSEVETSEFDFGATSQTGEQNKMVFKITGARPFALRTSASTAS